LVGLLAAAVGDVLAGLEDEEVWDLAPEALGVPDGGPEVGDVVLGADHGEHAGEADDAEVVEGDGVLEEGGLGAGSIAVRVACGGKSASFRMRRATTAERFAWSGGSRRA
jgi:hypothetical protein